MMSSRKIIDIACLYGYDTPESFSRAFTRFHGVSPLTARRLGGSVKTLAKISVQSILRGERTMESLSKRGYAVRDPGQVYYTKDMKRTMEWFEDVLGWYEDIALRDEQGTGQYGCAVPLPAEISSMVLAPFNGFHVFYGEPPQTVVAFMRVDKVDNLYAHVKRHGWEQISGIETQPWGGRECSVTTIDGSVIRFFEL